MDEGIFRSLKPVKSLYRTAGYNRGDADSVELDHWKTIHLYLTYRFNEDNVPSKLFVKPTGCQCFSGYFEIHHAFHIARGGKPAREFFGRYYFFPYEAEFKDRFTCLVYSRFRELCDEQGRELFEFLKDEDYAIHTRGSKMVSDAGHVRQIDRIIERE